LKAARRASLLLRNARAWRKGAPEDADILIVGDRVRAVTAAGTAPPADVEIDLTGRVVLPGLVNAHDHLDFSIVPALGRPPYANVYEWAADVNGGAGDPRVQRAMAVPEVDRLFLGGLRNLFAGVTAVLHHNPYHRSLGREEFPVRVQDRYEHAHSPGLTPHLRKSYRTTDRRIPWIVHALEGTDARVADEVAALRAANVLRQNTVIVHGIALTAETAAAVAEARASVVWCPESNRYLYDATAPVAVLEQVGVSLGLGSDSPASGVRDALSNLAAARREGVLSDDALVELATRGSAEVARLPSGAVEADGLADLLVVTSVDALLAGDRLAVSLVFVAGRARYGETALLTAAGRVFAKPPAPGTLRVDGAPRALEADLARRLATILRRHPAARGVPWAASLEID
jgi:cytosine/adenosine deaminase-related metal-dependent hydrolase